MSHSPLFVSLPTLCLTRPPLRLTPPLPGGSGGVRRRGASVLFPQLRGGSWGCPPSFSHPHTEVGVSPLRGGRGGSDGAFSHSPPPGGGRRVFSFVSLTSRPEAGGECSLTPTFCLTPPLCPLACGECSPPPEGEAGGECPSPPEGEVGVSPLLLKECVHTTNFIYNFNKYTYIQGTVVYRLFYNSKSKCQ